MLRIKEIMKSKGLTLQDVADSFEPKVTKMSIHSIVNGNPNLKNLEKIANVLGVPVRELFSDEENVTEKILYQKIDNEFVPVGKLDK